MFFLFAFDSSRLWNSTRPCRSILVIPKNSLRKVSSLLKFGSYGCLVTWWGYYTVAKIWILFSNENHIVSTTRIFLNSAQICDWLSQLSYYKCPIYDESGGLSTNQTRANCNTHNDINTIPLPAVLDMERIYSEPARLCPRCEVEQMMLKKTKEGRYRAHAVHPLSTCCRERR